MKKLRVPLIALGFTVITVAILAQTFPTTETFRITDSFSEVKRKLNQSGVTVAALTSVGTNLAVALPVAKGGTGATNAAGARSSLGIPESTTNTVQTLATGGTGATTAAGARTALGLGEYLTNAVTALPAVLGIEVGSVTTSADNTVTNTFASAYASPPVVVIAQIGEALSVTNNITVTETSFVYDAGQPSQVANFIVFGTR